MQQRPENSRLKHLRWVRQRIVAPWTLGPAKFLLALLVIMVGISVLTRMDVGRFYRPTTRFVFGLFGQTYENVDKTVEAAQRVIPGENERIEAAKAEAARRSAPRVLTEPEVREFGQKAHDVRLLWNGLPGVSFEWTERQTRLHSRRTEVEARMLKGQLSQEQIGDWYLLRDCHFDQNDYYQLSERGMPDKFDQIMANTVTVGDIEDLQNVFQRVSLITRRFEILALYVDIFLWGTDHPDTAVRSDYWLNKRISDARVTDIHREELHTRTQMLIARLLDVEELHPFGDDSTAEDLILRYVPKTTTKAYRLQMWRKFCQMRPAGMRYAVTQEMKLAKTSDVQNEALMADGAIDNDEPESASPALPNQITKTTSRRYNDKEEPRTPIQKMQDDGTLRRTGLPSERRGEAEEE